MNDRQEEKFNAYSGSDEVLTDAAAIVETVPALADAHDQLQHYMDEIEEAAGLKETVRSGKGAAKREAKSLLVKALVRAAGLLVAEGSATANAELTAQARYTPSSFTRTRDGRLPSIADTIHALATAHKTALQRRGLDDAQLAQLQTRIDDFRRLTPAPRLAREAKTVQVERLAALFTATDKLLNEQMDPMLRNLEDRHPELVQRWFASRSIDSTPGARARTAGATS